MTRNAATLTRPEYQALVAHITATVQPEGRVITGVSAGVEVAWAANQREAYHKAIRKARAAKRKGVQA